MKLTDLVYGRGVPKVCDLVGTFSLDKISVKYDKNSIGLYHDNELSVFKNST